MVSYVIMSLHASAQLSGKLQKEEEDEQYKKYKRSGGNEARQEKTPKKGSMREQMAPRKRHNRGTKDTIHR